jgi:hypothetical protein
MPQNTNPIFPLTPDIQWARIASGNTAFDGTGPATTVFSASFSGSRVDFLKIRALGTNNTSSLMRFFINNGATSGSAINNSLFLEYPLPTTVSSSTAEAGSDNIIPLNIALPTAYRINASLSTTLTGSAGVGWQVTAVGGDY